MSACYLFLEMLDKEPSLLSLWSVFGMVAILGFYACRFRFWLSPLPLLLSVGLFLASLEEFHSVNLITSMQSFTSGESPAYVVQFFLISGLAMT